MPITPLSLGRGSSTYQFRRTSKASLTDQPVGANLYTTAELVVSADAKAAASLLTVEADDENERSHRHQRGLGRVWESWWCNGCEEQRRRRCVGVDGLSKSAAWVRGVTDEICLHHHADLGMPVVAALVIRETVSTES